MDETIEIMKENHLEIIPELNNEEFSKFREVI